jgi:probable HAF family extracellular repeat protein
LDSLAHDLLLTDVSGLWLRFAADIAAKTFLFLLLCLGCNYVLRRSSSAFRHSLLTLSFLCLFLLPLAPALGLEWKIPMFTLPQARGSLIAARLYSSHYFSAVLFLAWLAGFVAVLSRLVVGFWLMRRLTREATPLRGASWLRVIQQARSGLHMSAGVRVLASDRLHAAVCAGFLRPVILMPAESEDWSDEQRLMILRHELGHLRRRDNWTNILALFVCAFYWFNPLVWAAARRLRLCREAACDDLVLGCGVKPSEYASYLLEAASSRQTGLVALALSQAAALRKRLFAILDPAVNRRLAKARQVVPCAALAMLILLATAALQPWIVPAFRGGLARSLPLDDRGLVSQVLAWLWTPVARPTAGAPEAGFVGYSGNTASEEVGSSSARYFDPALSSVAVISSLDFRSEGRVSRRIANWLAPSWPRSASGWIQPSQGGAFVQIQGGEAKPTPDADGGSNEGDLPPTTDGIQLSRLDLGTLGGDESAATDINEAGQIVGQSTTKVGETKPFLWSKASGILDLPCPSVTCHAVDINNAGQVLIASQDEPGTAEKAYLWTPSSGLRDLGSLGGVSTHAYALNDLGQVAGSSETTFETENAFFWSAQTGMINLGGATAIGLNERGQVLGWASTYAFLWDSADGSFARIGPVGLTATPLDMNNAGEVVGYAAFEKGGKPKAFLWTPLQGITELTLPGDTDGSCAFRINDAGEVLGVSRVAGEDHIYLVGRNSAAREVSLPSALVPKPNWPERAEIPSTLLIGSNLPSFALAEELAKVAELKDDRNQISQLVRMNGKGQIAGNLIDRSDNRVGAVLWEVRLPDVEKSIESILGQIDEIQAHGYGLPLVSLRFTLEDSLLAVKANDFRAAMDHLSFFLNLLGQQSSVDLETRDPWIQATWQSLERLSQFTVLQ